MQIFLDNILDSHTLKAITDSLSNDALYEDGKKTAGRTARRVKSNLQARPDAVEVKGALKLIEKALMNHPVFKAAALPQKFAKLMINRYGPGMQYGTHVDDPIIAGTRTDLSFTLFLSDPETYEGGELVLCKHDGEEKVKLPKGALTLYPSTTLHHVAEVTEGTRLAAVGWVQSRVRLAEHREILFDLHTALAQLPDTDENLNARMQILKAKSNLTRIWAD
ncbi:Fe2+-dependent dioxygenase [Kordiimonas sp. SCSIO 12603]|uniref:Fe2+-dependent dioxygenase n=1 Tax=Kordiimonas sp. SCSIO 12603 TaxID=2829596 RepID=UPI002104B4F9|nr:Fe2+-dependent dioxygenase [Kordiimonas sp. SCSIO 12603]UTW60279.1 Fe2+-dependent dioxygenase [Kordiimonas sp. SCSIO 12603]